MELLFETKEYETGTEESMTDMEKAVLYADHIVHPCVNEITGESLRSSHVKGARELIPSFENPWAKEFLEGIIRGYEKI